MYDRNRVNDLQRQVLEGEEAKVVKKYADMWLEEEKQNTLDSLARFGSDPQAVKMQYLGACRFARRIDELIAQGERKWQIIERLKKEERG